MFVNMAPVESARIISLILLCAPVCSSLIQFDRAAEIGECSSVKTSADFEWIDAELVRLRLCTCHDLRNAKSLASRSCQSQPVAQLTWNRTQDANCFVSNSFKLNARPGESFLLCSSSRKKPRDLQAETNLRLADDGEASVDFKPAVITGLRVEEADKGVTYDDGASVVLAGTPVTVRLFGYDFSDSSEFRFVLGARERGADCDNLPFTVTVHVDKSSLTTYSTLVRFRLPSSDQLSESNLNAGESPAFYVCSLEKVNGYNRWIHQGREPGVKLRTFQRTLPLWIQVVIIAVLLTLSGLFSGLNLGLMALDRTELKILENTGKDKEKRYAKAISPVRNHGNYLLCTLLLGNVLVNSTLTILLDDLTSGVIAIVGSTLGIVIFGEIIPQAICSRFGLAIGAHTVWITKFFMIVTFPLSYPISLLLDRILGEEIGAYYNRERLKELIKVTNEYHDLEKDEVNIIAGALELRRKTVGDIMTRLEDVFMLSYDAVLDFETVSEIMKQGFSRIPVYEGERSNIIALLFIKELALIDPEDATPLKTICQFYQNQCNFVFEDTTLDVMFRDFKEGHKGHMAFVQRVNCEGEGDPFYETVGLVTLEDVIEELIQAEIVDETDVWMDNRSKRRREKGKLLQDFSSFAVQYRESTAHKITPQLALATFQFISSSMEPFKVEWISENVLRRLMQHDQAIRFIRVKKKDMSKEEQAETIIYQQGKPADYFALVLEGRVEVTVGKENLVFEGGPFTYYGMQALTGVTPSSMGESPSSIQLFRGSIQSFQASPTADGAVGLGNGPSGGVRGVNFIPDYTVRAVCDVVYFRVTRSLYQAARSATLLERAQRDATSRPNDYESDVDPVFGSAKGDEGDLLSNAASEPAPFGELDVGSQRSLNNRSANQDVSWSRQSLSRPVVGRHARSSDKSGVLGSSLPTTSSVISSDGLCRANDVHKTSEDQTASRVISASYQKLENAVSRAEPNRCRRVSSPAQTYVPKQNDELAAGKPAAERQALLESSNGSES